MARLLPTFAPLSAAIIAFVLSSVGFHPEMEPSSLTKMNMAGWEFPFLGDFEKPRAVEHNARGISLRPYFSCSSESSPPADSPQSVLACRLACKALKLRCRYRCTQL